MRKYIRAIEYNIEAVGKTIKSSKKRHSWTAKVDAKEFKIVYTRSSMSGKNRIEVNGSMIFQDQSHFGSFNHSFETDGVQFVIKEGPDTYHLIIDGKDFADIFGQDKIKSILKKCRYEEELEKQALGGGSDSTRLAPGNQDPRQRSSLRAGPESRSKSAKKVHFNLENNTFHDVQPPKKDLQASGQQKIGTEPQVSASQLYPEIQAIVDQNSHQVTPVIFSSTIIDEHQSNHQASTRQGDPHASQFYSGIQGSAIQQYPNSSFGLAKQQGPSHAEGKDIAAQPPFFRSNLGTQGHFAGHSAPLPNTNIPSQPYGDVGPYFNQQRPLNSIPNGGSILQKPNFRSYSDKNIPGLNNSLNESTDTQSIDYNPLQYSTLQNNPSTVLASGTHIPLFASQLGDKNPQFQQIGASQQNAIQGSALPVWNPRPTVANKLVDTRGSTSVIGSQANHGSNPQPGYTQMVPGLNSSQISNSVSSNQRSQLSNNAGVASQLSNGPNTRVVTSQYVPSVTRMSIGTATPLGSYIQQGSVINSPPVKHVEAGSHFRSGFEATPIQQVSLLTPNSTVYSSNISAGSQPGRGSIQSSELGTRVLYHGPPRAQ